MTDASNARTSGKPRFLLHGSLVPRSQLPNLITLGRFVVTLFTVIVAIALIGRLMATPKLDELDPLVAVGLVVLAGMFCALLFLGYRSSRSILAIYKNRVVVDGRLAGDKRVVTMDYSNLRWIDLKDRTIRLHDDQQCTVEFRGELLHVEDAFDTLLELVEAINPSCDVRSGR